MYDVVLLHRLTSDLLSHYKVIVVPNIPWMNDDQIAAIRAYKKNGGKIYTIGSTHELRELADLQSTVTVLEEAHTAIGRRELLSKLAQLSGEQLIQLDGTNYVAANVVKKTDSDRVILHLVNYDKPLKNVRVKLNLDGVVKRIDAERVKLFSPDAEPEPVEVVAVRDSQVELVLPTLEVYDIVAIN
jgi:hypothetical protein